MAQLISTKVNGDLEVTGSATLTSPLAISSGGTGATTKSDAFKNIFGYSPSGYVMYKNEDTVTSTSYNYFHVSYGSSNWTKSYSWGSHLSLANESVTWGERTMTNACIKVADDAPAGCVMVVGTVRYTKDTSSASSVQTAIIRCRDGTSSAQTWAVGTYDSSSSERISHSFSQLIWVEPGDLIWLGGYKGTASHSLTIKSGISTKWGAYYVYAS